MKIRLEGRHYPARKAALQQYKRHWGGQFFSEIFFLREGHYSVRIHVALSPRANGESIAVSARVANHGDLLASTSLKASPDARHLADEIYLDFEVGKSGFVEILGVASENCQTTLLRHLTIASSPGGRASREIFFSEAQQAFDLSTVDKINLGTTGICNASCIHCPTNKLDLRMPNGTMSMALFVKLLDELVEGNFAGEISFALFAEPLQDRFLVERLELARQRLPHATITIATNGALFDLQRHDRIFELVDNIAVHVESADAQSYDRIMHPLRSDKVFPKVEQIIRTAEAKKRDIITLTAPIHKDNLLSFGELNNLFQRTSSTGYLNPGSLSSGCRDGGPFWEMAIAPTAVGCPPEVLRSNLFIDWDGAVLPCCRDFSKSMVLGSLNSQSFAEIVAGDAWKRISDMFTRGEWNTSGACSKCRVDEYEVAMALLGRVTPPERTPKLLPASDFRLGIGASLDPAGVIRSNPAGPDGCIVYGPYISVPPGNYRAHFDVGVNGMDASRSSFRSDKASISIDVSANGTTSLVTQGFLLANATTPDFRVDFSIATTTTLEFRIFKTGDAAITFRGVVLERSLEGDNHTRTRHGS